MARCDVEGCDWVGKAKGKAIHMAKIHGIHPEHDDEDALTCHIEGDSESWVLEAEFDRETGKPLSIKQIDPIDQFVKELEEEYGR
jgi:hypothetical protein